jgi:hypothetical protein
MDEVTYCTRIFMFSTLGVVMKRFIYFFVRNLIYTCRSAVWFLVFAFSIKIFCHQRIYATYHVVLSLFMSRALIIFDEE